LKRCPRSRAGRPTTKEGESPRGEVAAWLGAQFRVPLVASPGDGDPDATTGMFLDPQTRMSFHVGVVLSYIESWDLFARVAIVDRGDFAEPGTTLPILDGGFDQTHVIFGITRRFAFDRDRDAPLMIVH